jgi:RNA polymerase sigma factor (sigma-70 family)
LRRWFAGSAATVVRMVDDLETLMERARSGDRESLERLIEQLQQPVYNLGLRMLWHPEDARDATQEILIRVITHLGSFRGESRVRTWVFRIAANYLSTARHSCVEAQAYTFDRFATELHDGLADVRDQDEWPPDKALLLEEVKVGCMYGLLTCLDRPHRLAYVLGEILEFDGVEAASILAISPAAFRKRLSRAREALVAFTRAHCGIVDPVNACRCVRRLPRAQAMQRVRADALLFAQAESASGFPETLAKVRRLDVVRRTAALYRTSPQLQPGPELLERLRDALGSL